MFEKVMVGAAKIELALEENVKGGKALNPTSVGLMCDGKAFYVEFKCYDDLIISRGIEYNARLYEGDVAELFVTLGAKERYLELEVNPDGARYAVIVELHGDNRKITPLANCPFLAHTDKIPGGWRTEWKIPLDGLKRLGYDEDNAYFNLYRQDFREDGTLMLYALNPTLSTTFHRPQFFVKLEIKK